MTQRYSERVSLGVSYAVCFGPDGSSLYSSTSEQIERWDVSDQPASRTGAFRDAGATGMEVSPDGGLLAAATTDDDVASVVLDASSLECVARGREQGVGDAFGPVFAADGRQYAYVSAQGDLVVVAADSGEVVLREREEGRVHTGIACSLDRTLFAYGGVDNNPRSKDSVVWVRRWPFDEHAPEKLIEFRSRFYAPIGALAFDGRGRLLVRCGSEFSIWDPESGECHARGAAGQRGAVGNAVWMPSGDLLAVNGRHRATVLTAELEERWSVEVPYTCAVACAPSGRLVAIGSWENGVVLEVSND